MFDQKVSQEQIDYATNLPHINNANNLKDGSTQVYGKIGEVVICDLLDMPRPKYQGSDGGFDIKINGKKVDIKTITRQKDVSFKNYFTHNIKGHQIGYDVDFYLFTSYCVPAKYLTVCGYIAKPIFLHEAKLCPAGTVRTRGDGSTFETPCDLYEITQYDLQTINSIYDFQRIGT